VDLASADRGDVIERLLEQGIELPLAAGNGGDAELARCGLTRRSVDAEHGQTVPVELSLHRGGREIIGNLQLDCAKTGGGGRGEPLDERPLGEEKRQIGGEAGHAQIHRRARRVYPTCGA
jgi:hypothetical protein